MFSRRLLTCVFTTFVFLGSALAHATEAMPLMGHTAGINDIDFSPDGKLLASASDDATARVWQLDGLRPYKVFEHEYQVVHLAFLGNKRLLTVISSAEPLEQTVRGRKQSVAKQSVCFVWDVATGKQLHKIRQVGRVGNGAVLDCVGSADGRYAALTMFAEGLAGTREVALYNVKDFERSFGETFLYNSHTTRGSQRFPSIGFAKGGCLLAYIGTVDGKRGDQIVTVVDCAEAKVLGGMHCGGSATELTTHR